MNRLQKCSLLSQIDALSKNKEDREEKRQEALFFLLAALLILAMRSFIRLNDPLFDLIATFLCTILCTMTLVRSVITQILVDTAYEKTKKERPNQDKTNPPETHL